MIISLQRCLFLSVLQKFFINTAAKFTRVIHLPTTIFLSPFWAFQTLIRLASTNAHQHYHVEFNSAKKYKSSLFKINRQIYAQSQSIPTTHTKFTIPNEPRSIPVSLAAKREQKNTHHEIPRDVYELPNDGDETARCTTLNGDRNSTDSARAIVQPLHQHDEAKTQNNPGHHQYQRGGICTE